MKFKAYDAKRKVLEAAQTAHYEAGESQRQELSALYTMVKREWDLGSPRFLDSGARVEHGNVFVVYDGGDNVRIEVRDNSMNYYRMELSGQYLRLGAEQWHMFAEIADALIRWRAGELDELPKNGAWITRRPK